MPDPVVAKVQLAAGGATQGGPSDRFLLGVARPGEPWAASLPFLWVPGYLQREKFQNRVTHVSVHLKVCVDRAVFPQPDGEGLRRLGGAAGAPPAGGVRPRSAVHSGLPGAAGALTAPHSGGGGNGGGARIRTPPRRPGGRGSKGLNCQRRDVKQVSKAPHISAD